MNLDNPIAVGNTAKIYLKNNKIIKVFNDFIADAEAIHEASKQQYAFSCGLPVPEILEVTTIGGKHAIVMEYIKGKTLGDLLLENKEKAEYYLDMSIHVQLEIHRTTPNNIESMYERLYHQINSAKILNNNQKACLLRKLDTCTFETKLCHGDFHLFNLIMHENKVVVIDWADATAGDIRADICRSYLLYSQFSTNLAETYLHLYSKKSGLLRSDIFQWTAIIAGARLSENIPTESANRLLQLVHNYCKV